MGLTEFLNTFFLIIVLLAAIGLFNFALKRAVHSLHKLTLAFAVFFLLSLVCLLMSFFSKQADELHTAFDTRIIMQCLWWFSLNFLANQLVAYFVWNKMFLSKGVAVSRILKDLFGLVLLIITIAAIVHFVFAKSVLGIFTASGVVAIILGYSAQATLSDVFAGLGLNIAKQFTEGDWIKVLMGSSGYEGKVVDINWRFVNLLTHEGDHLSIPNSVIAKLAILNFSQPTPERGAVISIPFSGAFSPEVIKKILLSAADQSNKVLVDPPPCASILQFRGLDFMYQLLYYTNDVNETIVNDEILSIVWYQCARLGIKTSISDVPPQAVYSQDVLESFLRQTDLFSALDAGEIVMLAANCICRNFGPPERILVQGQCNESLFLIYQGSVDVYIITETKAAARVATLNAGQYFAEMSLLTGELCSASIIVNTQSMIIEINHDNMATLFAHRPELIDKISEVVIMRKQQNEDLRNSLQKDKNKEQMGMISRLAERVRSFYNLIVSKH